MLPTKFVNAFIVLLGCIAAINLGSFLSYAGDFGIYLMILAIPTTIFAMTNNFPFLVTFVVWFPFPLPMPGVKLPLLVPMLAVLAIIGLIQICMTRSLRYVPSCSWWIFACYAWVPLRFLLKPVTKLGAQFSGGSGVSGLTSYFEFVSTAALIVLLGIVINTRERVIKVFVWSARICLFWAFCMLGAAYNDTLHQIYVALGGFNAGYITAGVHRIVLLPSYAYFLLGAVFCPVLFQIKKLRRLRCILYGFFCVALIVIGGNRAALLASLVFVAVLLVLNRKFVLGVVLAAVLATLLTSTTVMLANGAQDSDIPSIARVLGVFSSRIDDASGGSASANWRYRVWESGIRKIMNHPLLGNGYGNLPKHLDLTTSGVVTADTDYEVVLSMGEAHNGYINAAYGLGIPMALGLTLALLWRIVVHTRAALLQDARDIEMREFHAFTASYLTGALPLIYTGFSLCALSVWFYLSLGFVIERLNRKKEQAASVGGEAVFYPTLAQYGAH